MTWKQGLEDSAGRPLFKLAHWVLECESFKVLLEAEVHNNPHELAWNDGHCSNCCMFDEKGKPCWFNENCKGCEGTTSVESCINETGSWLMEVIECNRCDKGGEEAHSTGTTNHAMYYAKKRVQQAAEAPLRALESRVLRDELRRVLRDWACIERDETDQLLGAIFGLAWAAGVASKDMQTFYDSQKEEFAYRDEMDLDLGFLIGLPSELDWDGDFSFMEILTTEELEFPDCLEVFLPEPLEEAEIEDFWILRCRPVIEPREDRIEVRVFVPLPTLEPKSSPPFLTLIEGGRE